ncbi:hypothetical protein N0B31_13805 [Salinirubellus salinus]|uniref:CARDB domain-containing protein n=1 Tax=Salinirubellus salinus TaxID=1364945 RepID=A0A9E7R1M0_9EURY|nr:hypothetical protein [Salinirubellus salinus]UWM53213.1 hypothetical protein N0B31_13805 [Salinirubellus salinus]
MRRLLAVLMVLFLLTPTAAVAAVPDARITVSDVTVAPDGPVTGEPVTVTATVQNSGGSPEPVEIDRVVLRRADGGERLATADEPGALSQGGALTVDLVTEFEAAGRVDLEVVAVGTDTNGNETRAVRPFTVVVERAPPTMDVVVADPVVGVESDVAVTVSNPSATERRNLELTLSGPDGERTRATVPALAAGASTTVNLSLRPNEAGPREGELSLAYTTSTGDRARTTQSLAYEVTPFREDLGVSVSRTPPADGGDGGDGAGLGGAVAGGGGGGGGDGTPDDTGPAESVTVEVTNFGNTAASGVVVRPVLTSDAAADRTLPREPVGDLAPGESATVQVDLGGRPIGVAQTLNVTLAYTAATDRNRVVTGATYDLTTLRQDVGVAVRRAPEQMQQQQAGGQLGALLGAAGGGAAGGGGGTLQSQDAGDEPREAAEVEVTNFGNVPVSEVVVRPVAGETELPRRSVGSLEPGESDTVTVDLSGLEGATLTATVEYRYGAGAVGTVTGTYDYAPASGEVRLTDVNLEFTEDGRLLVTGNTGNVGDSEVTAVVVSVGESEHVSPAYPQRDYFVGSVESSEFAPFELTADVDAENATEIPVQITYRTGGEERTETVTLPYDSALAPEDQQRGLSLGGVGIGVDATGALAGVLLALIVLVPTAYLARRR